MTSLVVPIQWPIKAVPRVVSIAAANTPILLMAANQQRTYYVIGNDMVTASLSAGLINYSVFQSLYVSFGNPQTGNSNGSSVPKGILVPPGAYLPSEFGGVSQQEIWVWSGFEQSAPWTLIAYEGVNDPAFNPNPLNGS